MGIVCRHELSAQGIAPLLQCLAHIEQDRADTEWLSSASPKFGRYERLAQRLGVADQVKFLGFRADPSNAYFASDFLVHPTFYDPCSLVVLESLCCGLPVMTSRYNGASELISPPKEGFVIDDPHDHRSLGEAIAKLLDPAVRSACAAPPARRPDAGASNRIISN